MKKEPKEQIDLASKLIANVERNRQRDNSSLDRVKGSCPAAYYAAKIMMRYRLYKMEKDAGRPDFNRPLYCDREVALSGVMSCRNQLSFMVGESIPLSVAPQVYAILVRNSPTLSDEAIWINSELLWVK